jgi:hypothetical protein
MDKSHNEDSLTSGDTSMTQQSHIGILYGGRDYRFDTAGHNQRWLDALRTTYAINLLITGGALGADREGYDWAQDRGVDQLVVPANWTRDGKPAGPIRNKRLVDLAQLLSRTSHRPLMGIEFPGGKGTANMRERLIKNGITIERKHR